MAYYQDPADSAKIHWHNAEKALKAAKDFTNKLLSNKHETGLLFTGPVGSGKTIWQQRLPILLLLSKLICSFWLFLICLMS
jgi:tRNA A37 threonylcarbamoyladenosine biosynthesis protein TsaE